MTKEEALQKVNDYCNEKSYTNETLTDAFKDKFAEHLAKRYPEAKADDETAIADMKFAINSAFSGASLIITEKTNAFTAKENEYKRQIEELKKKTPEPPKPQTPEIPKEWQEKFERLENFEKESRKRAKLEEVLALAKKSVRADLHASFEKYASDFQVDVEKKSDEQAQSLVAKFQDIFKETIGDIKPLAPRQIQKRDEEIIAQIGKIEI